MRLVKVLLLVSAFGLGHSSVAHSLQTPPVASDTIVLVDETPIALSAASEGGIFGTVGGGWVAVGCFQSSDLQIAMSASTARAGATLWNTLAVLAHDSTYIEESGGRWTLKKVSLLKVSVVSSGYTRLQTKTKRAEGGTYLSCTAVKPSAPVVLERVRATSIVEIVP